MRRRNAWVDGRHGQYRVLLNQATMPSAQFCSMSFIEWCMFDHRATAQAVADSIHKRIASIHDKNYAAFVRKRRKP